MNYFTEDPSYLLIGLGVAVLVCLLALKITQQGKFLIWAGVLAVVAGLVFGFERFWVTDAERVEAVVYDLADSVQQSNVERIKAHLDEDVAVGSGGRVMEGSIPLKMIFGLLQNCRFDFVKISQLSTTVGRQNRVGKAGFKASATGTFREGGTEIPIGSLGTEWELTFRETSPGVWKVTRIQAIKLPPQVNQAQIFK